MLSRPPPRRLFLLLLAASAAAVATASADKGAGAAPPVGPSYGAPRYVIRAFNSIMCCHTRTRSFCPVVTLTE